MKVNRKYLIIILTIVVVLVASLTIVYAALSASLIISGSGTVSATNWGVSISNSNTTTFGNTSTGDATFTTPIITGTTIADYSVSLTKPGDSVTLFFALENTGDINAEVASVINSTPVCTSETGNTADASLVCDNLNISLNYYTDESVVSGNILSRDSMVCYEENSSSGILPYLMLSLSLDSSMTSVPGSKVTISNLKHEINFIQTEKNCNPSGIASPR